MNIFPGFWRWALIGTFVGALLGAFFQVLAFSKTSQIKSFFFGLTVGALSGAFSTFLSLVLYKALNIFLSRILNELFSETISIYTSALLNLCLFFYVYFFIISKSE